METINFADTAVGELVRQRPARSRVFERFGVDYCCGGKITLNRACLKKQIDVEDVCKELAQCEEDLERDQGIVDADSMTLTELADHIENTHHAYLRAELPRLEWMTEKVARVHGDHDPRLHDLRRAFVAFRGEVEPHTLKEDNVLFPIIRQLEASDGPQEFHCGSVANPIRQMELEHDDVGEQLALMHAASDGYTPPEWACNTYRAMLSSLTELERDMHQHIHKENNVLFPKAIELESKRA